MIAAVVSEKGGTGKTTIAIHLAGWRHMTGRDVMLLDSDRQGSAGYWVEIRKREEMPAPETMIAVGTGLRRAVINAAREYDDVIVDVGAGQGADIRTLMGLADVVIVPLQPTGMDFWTVGLLDSMAMDGRKVNDRLVVKAVLNRAPTHHVDMDAMAAQDALAQCQELTASGIVIRERSSIRRVVPLGRLVDEWQPKDRKGIEELGAVYKLVYGESLELADETELHAASAGRR